MRRTGLILHRRTRVDIQLGLRRRGQKLFTKNTRGVGHGAI